MSNLSLRLRQRIFGFLRHYINNICGFVVFNEQSTTNHPIGGSNLSQHQVMRLTAAFWAIIPPPCKVLHTSLRPDTISSNPSHVQHHGASSNRRWFVDFMSLHGACQTRLHLQFTRDHISDSPRRNQIIEIATKCEKVELVGARSFAGRQKEELPQGPKYQSCIPLCQSSYHLTCNHNHHHNDYKYHQLHNHNIKLYLFELN